MILYHGSYMAVERPDLSFSRERTDFGRGFYLTPFKEQAEFWAERFREKRGVGVVSSYGFLERITEKLPDDIRILEFNTHSLKWLNFVTACRLGARTDDEWDLVIGGVADDKVIITLQLYFREVITAREAIRRLRYNKPNFQYCFKNQSILDRYIGFIEARNINASE